MHRLSCPRHLANFAAILDVWAKATHLKDTAVFTR